MLAQFGTALPELEEDEIPSKKPVRIEDQIVTDENGKRRFHGAFTGGFSAGFWNTVGSQEGWTPQNFKSSRSEKASKIQQRPTDFMDSEDLGEFGIAPHRIQATKEFASEKSGSKANKRQYCGTILGGPIFENLIEPVKEKVAVRILRRMGWKPGQGIGPRLTKQQKKSAAERNNRQQYVMRKYGCELPSNEVKAVEENKNNTDSSEDDYDDDITFAPDDYQALLATPKTNLFGLGYEGLSRDTVLSSGKDTNKEHINLFGHLEAMAQDKQKLTIKGQAFGVGALEEDDDDIYARDDLSKYDFSLESNKNREKRKKTTNQIQDGMILEGFVKAKDTSSVERSKYTINLPSNYKPRNWAVRKSRFEPLDNDKLASLSLRCEYKIRGLGRHDLNPDERGKILGENKNHENSSSSLGKLKPSTGKAYWEELNKKYQERENKTKNLLELISSKADSFTKGGILEGDQEKKIDIEPEAKLENEKVLGEAKKKTESLGSVSSTFKPFAGNNEKQVRYEKFLEENPRTDDEIEKFLSTIQPIHLSEWDREVEKKEFIQARKIYKPLEGYMSERFVSETTIKGEKQSKIHKSSSNENSSIAVVVVVVRTKSMWKPCSQLCKRYNIAEPFGGTMVDIKEPKKNKLSVFDYLEHSVNTKTDFITPVIIPKQIEKPKPILRNEKETSSPLEEIAVKETIGTLLSSNENQTTSIVEQKSKQQSSRFKQPPKTELEKRIEESKNKPISEKVDLFKAIFEDSEDDDNQDEEKTRIVEEKTDDKILPTVSQEIANNLLRNNSPPRGIFAALFAPKAKVEVVKESLECSKMETIENEKPLENQKIIFQPRNKEKCDKVVSNNLSLDENLYGPKLPETIAATVAAPVAAPVSSSDHSSTLDRKIIKLLNKQQQQQQQPQKKSNSNDLWIEKDETAGGDANSAKKSKKMKKLKEKIKNNSKNKKSKKAKKRKKEKK